MVFGQSDILGATIGFLGLLFGLYQSYKKRDAQLVYIYIGQELIDISSGIVFGKEIKLEYNNEIISTLSITQIIIWNKGGSPIRKGDISEEIKLCVGSGSKVLKCEVVKYTRPENKVNVSINDEICECIDFTFDYLEPNDGATLKILHTSKETKPSFTGAVIGMPRGCVNLGRISTQESCNNISSLYDSKIEKSLYVVACEVLRSVNYGYILMVYGIFLIPLSFSKKMDGYVGIEVVKASELYPFTIAGIVLIIIGAYKVFFKRKKYPKKLTPDEYSAGEG